MKDQTKLQTVYSNSAHSVWLDNLSRDLIQSGKLKNYVNLGIRGITTNPSIFQKALEQGEAYNNQLTKCRTKGFTAERTYWELIKKDVIDACDILAPLYEESHHVDGYVSVEVDPRLAHDTDKTVAQARELWKSIKRPNVMIKVPATKAGLPAITQLTELGINVNVTLIFSLHVYQEVIESFMKGLENRKGDINSIASVASFFVSRLDVVVDDQLPEDSELRGKAAIAQAHRAYRLFQDSLASPRWKQLASLGAMPQRPLWASTSTKNPDYPDTLYVDALIAPHSVNTAPENTIEAYIDHGSEQMAITDETMATAGQTLAQLAQHEIDIRSITDTLAKNGVAQFIDSFNDPMQKLKRIQNQ